MDYKKMNLKDLTDFIEKEKVIKDIQMEVAYAASTPQEFIRLSTIACKKVYTANLYLKLLVEPVFVDLDDIGTLIPFEEFISLVRTGSFIDDDGYGYYSTDSKKSNVSISPSNVLDGIYRKDFSNVLWYNR